jgi:erythronate-4-phosphate dehydrogenase
MKIYHDENMPFAAELFAPLGEVHAFAGRQCTPQLIADADVLLVRSITQVNESLLAQAKNLKFVGTATIGTDHIDQTYLQNRGIAFASSPGCNAVSVAEYVLSAIKVLEQRYLFSLQHKTVGIVGAGNTGSRLADKLTALGVNFVLCDPVLEAAGDCRDFVDYDHLLKHSDILSFHVPLVNDGEYPTRHLFGATQLAKIKPNAVIINACRGEVIDNHALLEAKQAKQNGNNNPLVLDVWEGEPDILAELLPYVDIATAHIAGYSYEGKAKGTVMLYQALCEVLGEASGEQQGSAQNISQQQLLDGLLPPADITDVGIRGGLVANENNSGSINHGTINRVIHMVYDVRRDDALFRQHIFKEGFDWLRKHYPNRREFSALTVFNRGQNTVSDKEQNEITTFARLGFKVEESNNVAEV